MQFSTLELKAIGLIKRSLREGRELTIEKDGGLDDVLRDLCMVRFETTESIEFWGYGLGSKWKVVMSK